MGEERGAAREFISDIRRSFGALTKDPRLPLLTLSLFLVTTVPSFLAPPLGTIVLILVMPASIFYVGYVGAERIWFARLFEGLSMDLRGVWKWGWHLWPRFFTMGLLVMLLSVPLLIPLTIQAVRIGAEIGQDVEEEMERQQRLGNQDPQQLSRNFERRIEERFGVGRDPRETARKFLTPSFVVMSIMLGLLVDFLLTFTTQALAFTTSNPIDALKENFRLIRRTLPTSLFYVLIPPLAALLTLRILPITGVGVVLYFALTAVGALLNLWFKGACAAFYLRHRPMPVEVGTSG